MTAPDLALAETDPAGFVLAVAELREARAEAVAPGPWKHFDSNEGSGNLPGWMVANDAFHNPPADDEDAPWLAVELHTGTEAEAEHLAAEGNPAHALAEVRQWRGVVERHGRGLGKFGWCDTCGKVNGSVPYPCPDLLLVVAAAKAYVGGAP